MPRNVRQKYPPAPVRATKRRDYDSSSPDLSDDDSGYSGVEEVSDSDEDDEEHVFAAEVEHIITNASRKRALGHARPLVEEEEDDADEESEGDENDDAESEDGDPADDSASWDGILSDNDEPVPAEPMSTEQTDRDAIPVERHVRFAGVPDSDSDSTTSETSDSINDFFPDIFVEQSALDPSFRREIEDDDETSSNGSFWDFHGGSQDRLAPDSDDELATRDDDVTPMATPRPSQPPTEASTHIAVPVDVQDLDGYESEFVYRVWARLVLTRPRQPTAIPPRKMCRNPSSAKSKCVGSIPSRCLQILTQRGLFGMVLANLVLVGST
jgi:hypothetical protein